MIHIIKNYKWVIGSSLICITFGLLTFFTFINQSFIKLNDYNLQVLLIIDLFLLIKLKQIIGCYSSGFVRFYLIRNNIKLHKYMANTNQG